MSNLSQFGGGQKTATSIVNSFSSGVGGGQGLAPVASVTSTPIKKALSGALTAATLKTMLSLSGAGALKWISATCEDGTSRTVRLKITLDNVVVFDNTSASLSNASAGLLAVGNVVSAGHYQLEAVAYNTACVVEIASSLSETDKVALHYQYETR